METERAVVEDKFTAGELLYGEVLLQTTKTKGLESVGRCQQRVAVPAVIDPCVENFEMAVGMVELKDESGTIVYVVEHHDRALDSHEQTLALEVFLSAGGQRIDSGQFPITVELAVFGMLQQIAAGSEGEQDGDQQKKRFIDIFCHHESVSYLFVVAHN